MFLENEGGWKTTKTRDMWFYVEMNESWRMFCESRLHLCWCGKLGYKVALEPISLIVSCKKVTLFGLSLRTENVFVYYTMNMLRNNIHETHTNTRRKTIGKCVSSSSLRSGAHQLAPNYSWQSHREKRKIFICRQCFFLR